MDSVYQRHSQRVSTLLVQIHKRTKLQIPELLTLLLYPTTIILGQLLYHTSPELVTNYYTNKHNILNQLFVKRGWFWTLVVVGYFLIQHRRASLNRVVRLSLGTLWWVLFTQWFFGLPIMDRVFLWTGGLCEYDTLTDHGVLGEIGSVVCRKLKGHWIGGHDPSGHVFLLVHSSLIMWFELVELGVWQELDNVVNQFRRVRQQQRDQGNLVWSVLKLCLLNSSVLLVALLALWWWMLLVTSTHFHSFPEKLSGLIAGYIGLLIYIVPRFL